MRSKYLLLSLLIALMTVTTAWGQFKKEASSPDKAEFGESKPQRWKMGIILTAAGGPCLATTGYVPVPVDWPEQKVREINEDVSSSAKISYKKVDGVMKLMVIKISRLAAGQTAKALVTFEVTHRPQLPPEKTDQYVFANTRKLPRNVRRYLKPSPKIECKESKIIDLAKKLGNDQPTDWQKVEAVYDYVRDKIKYKRGRQKSAIETLKTSEADCEGMTALFIAICRAKNIPARTVWVQGHCYPEFYLNDKEGKGHWFPCQVAGDPAFGGIPETRPIWQKGDDFRLPDQPGTHVHYLPERITGSIPRAQPRARFVREAVSK